MEDVKTSETKSLEDVSASTTGDVSDIAEVPSHALLAAQDLRDQLKRQWPSQNWEIR